MNAGMTYSSIYAEEFEDDYFEEPESVFDNNLHGRAGESFQTGSFYRTANEPRLRSGYTGASRPGTTLYDHYGYNRPAPAHVTGEWFRPNSHFANTEAVYSYSSDEPFEQVGNTQPFKNQVRQIGDDLIHNRRAGAILILTILALLILGLFTWTRTTGRAEAEGDIYNFKTTNRNAFPTAGATPETKPQGNPPTSLPGSHSVIGVPTVTADKITQVLKQYNSPAVGASQAIYDLGVKYQIDPAYALAFFIHESSAGTKGVAVTTRSLGNIRQTTNSGFDGYNGFRKYPSWEVGAEDWYKLIKNLYIGGWNLTTVEQIIPKYAPAEDNNNPTTYINAVNNMVDAWRSGK